MCLISKSRMHTLLDLSCGVEITGSGDVSFRVGKKDINVCPDLPCSLWMFILGINKKIYFNQQPTTDNSLVLVANMQYDNQTFQVGMHRILGHQIFSQKWPKCDSVFLAERLLSPKQHGRNRKLY